MKNKLFFCVFFSTVLLSKVAFCQIPDKVFPQVPETFNSRYLYGGWKFHNNSEPKGQFSFGWTFGTPKNANDVNDPHGATNPPSDFNTYLHVGWDSGYDPDNSNLSKWAISPLMYVKNGDVIKFRTKQRITSCNKANRLQVRLNAKKLHYKHFIPSLNANVDSTLYLPEGVTSVGGFTELLLDINPTYAKTGTSAYKSDWFEYTCTISNLPQDEIYIARLGFRYFVQNAGPSSCFAPFAGVDLSTTYEALDIISTVADYSPVGGAAGDVIEVIGSTATFTAGALEATEQAQAYSQAGSYVNGSAIAIDDVELVPRRSVYMYDASQLPDYTPARVYDQNNLSNSYYLQVGYQGQPDCQINSNIPLTRYFDVVNTTSETIKVAPKFQAIEGSPEIGLFLDNMDSISIAPNSSTRISLRPRTDLQIGNLYPTKFWLVDKNGNVIAQAKFTVNLARRSAPHALCQENSVHYQLNNSGTPITVSPADFNNGSTNSCGGTDDLSFQIAVKNEQNVWITRNVFDCNDLGLKDIRLTVSDSKATSSAVCYTKIFVGIAITPIFQSNFTESKYLGQGPDAKLNVSTLTAPPLVNGCSAATVARGNIEKVNTLNPYNSTALDSPTLLGAGMYKVYWSAVDGAGNVGYGSSMVTVIDTVKPKNQILASVTIPFTEEIRDQLTGQSYGFFVKTAIKGKDFEDRVPLYRSYDNTHNSSSLDHRGIQRYELSSPWYNGGAWVSEIPFDCSHAGQSFNVTVRAYDFSGNFSTKFSTVTIAQATAPSCKNIEVQLDTWFSEPTIYIVPEQILEVGSASICGGVTSMALSRNQFGCADLGLTIPVTASYRNPQGVLQSCTGSVKIKPFSVSEVACEDTIIQYLAPSQLNSTIVSLQALVVAPCQNALSTTVVSTGSTNFNKTINTFFNESFNIGVSQLSRTTFDGTQNRTCSQTIIVIDTTKPMINIIPQNETFDIHYLSNSCTKNYEIVNIFDQFTYKNWQFTITGATDTTAIFRRNFYDDQHWNNKFVDLNIGVNTITLKAEDYAGNIREISYTVTVNMIGNIAPYISPAEFTQSYQFGQFCAETYNFPIESPVSIACPKDTVLMWYFEVRDSYNGNIIYDLDSIPYDEGALIPLKVSSQANPNNEVNNTIQFGYHDRENGNRIFFTYKQYKLIDQPNTIVCPKDTFINNSNNTSYTYDFSLPSPVATCNGAYWGYNVTGATDLKTNAQGITYSSQQNIALAQYDYSSAYPSIAHNQNATLTLNNGINALTYSYLEPSGNGSKSVYGQCSFKIIVNDISSPVLTCPANDTIYRTNLGSCTVNGLQSCQQIGGFNGPYGVGRIKLRGSNEKLVLDQSDLPNSVKFKSTKNIQIINGITYIMGNYNSDYIQLKANCDGNISFNWEYQAQEPQYFRPLITKSLQTNSISGFNQNNTGVQTGTYSVSVSAGETVFIGLYGAGYTNGYFKISNFSGPSAAIVSEIEQPINVLNSNLYFEHDVQATYSIGNHQIQYSLLNVNNSRLATCTQNLAVIDTHAGSLACSNQTAYLNNEGKFILSASDVISTCFNVSNTTLSQSIFDCSDVGVNSVTINSVDYNNDPLTCTFDLTIIDNIAPRIKSPNFDFSISNPGLTGTLTEAQMLAMFDEPCGIASISASKTSFNCSDAGITNITITAEDNNGNITNASVNLNILVDGFANEDMDTVYEACQNLPLNIYTGSKGSGFNYYWQQKDKIYDSLSWNFYSSDLYKLPVNGVLDYQFIKDIKLDYNYTIKGSYAVGVNNFGAPQNFYRLDPENQQWLPINIAPFTNSSRAFKLFKTGDGYMHILSVREDNNTFEFYKYRYETNSWEQVNLSLVNWTPYNEGVEKVYGNDDYVFTVNGINGYVIPHKITEVFTQSFQNFHRSTAADPYLIYVTNAKNIVGIRNGANQNMFFKINEHPNGILMQTKDSLTVDPTGGSDVFVMHSKNNLAYIAYKSTNGKACVKVFDGTSAWSNVGSLDFSANTISSIDLKTFNDTLYVLYKESSNQIRIKKFDGTNWVNVKNPHDNLSLSINSARLIDIASTPKIYVKSSVGAGTYILSQEGWKNVYANTSNASQNYFGVPTATVGTEEYRCITKTYDQCANTISGTKKVNIHSVPTIETSDVSILEGENGTLTANANIGSIAWFEDRGATTLVSSTNPFNTGYVNESKNYFVRALNSVCSSDTLTASIFVNDVNIPAIGITAPDSVCGGDQHVITLDTTQYISDLVYTLYQKSSNGQFTEVPNTSRSVNYFNIDVDETTTFKVLVRENQNNATTFVNLVQEKFVDFGNLSVASDDEITIEAWMEVQNFGEVIPPANFFQLSNAQSYAASNTNKNFEWIDGYFKVYNGSGTRWCAFPALPTVQNSTWMHVATTAGPSGLKIYYNGVLVASNNTAAASPINNGVHTLKFGKAYPDQPAPWGMGGLDEFRLWQRQRTQAEIQENMNVCMPNDVDNLIILNNFSDLNVENKIYNSVTGNDAFIETAGQPVYGAYREDQCTPNPISKRFLPEFTIFVFPNQGAITYSQNYPYSVYDEQTDQTTSNKILQCGPVFAPVKAISTSGQVNWYTHETGGSLITTGSEVNIYADKDTIIYVASSPKCNRYAVNIDIIEYPEIFAVKHDTICIGDQYNDIYLNVLDYSEETQDWDVYLQPTGGTPFDYRFDPTVLTDDDTLWLEAYNQYCTASTRVPFYVHIFKGVELNLPDYSYCGEGQVDFTLQYPSLEGFTWYTDQDVYIDWVSNGDVFSTPVLTDTTTYKVEPYHYNGGCYGEKKEITINVTPNKIQRDSILSCEPITWINGQTYTQSVSEVILTRPQTEGCDSVYYLNLQVSDLQNKYAMASASGACIGQTVTFTIYDSQNGKSYALVDLISGDTLNKVIGDGSNLSLQTTPLTVDLNVKVVAIDSLVNPNDLLVCEKVLGTFPLKAGESISNTDIVTCDSYEWRGETYSSSGTYRDTLLSVFGCDSIMQLNLTINYSYNNIINVTACDSYTWRGNTYTSSQQVVHDFGNTITGCDSLETLNLIIGHPNTGTAIVSACNSYTWIDGNTYTSSNNSTTHVLTNQYGCDSTVTLNLTIKNSTTGTDVISACDSYTWIDGNTYTSSNNSATHVLTNAVGCDSTVTLNLTIKNSTTGTDVISACNSYTWIDGNTYTSSNNSATHVLTNAVGCDSIVTLNLTIKNSTTGTDVISACNSYTWIDGNTYTSSNNSATHVLTNAVGCDSIVTLNLTIKNSTTGTDVISACNSYTWIDGNTYTSSNSTATHVLTNASGCDSTVTLNLTIKNSTTGTDVISACDSYTWIDGNTYTSSNTTATHVLTNAAGCDSTVTLNLTINTTPNADVLANVSSCGSYTLPALTVGNYFTGSGGTGTALIAGDVITSSQTIYVYAETGTTPNCTNENSFTVTILACSTQLASGSCGKQLTSMSDALYSDAVNGASNYRYEIRKQSDNSLVTVSTRGVNDNLFRLSWVNASLIQYNTTYSVKVAAYVNGSWMSYGTACNITTPILTKLSDASCNVSIPTLSTALYSDVVNGASNYRYEIRKQSDNSLVTVSTRGVNDNLFRLSWVNSSLIQYNTTYSIKVAAYVNGSWMPYGTACNVTTPKITKLDQASCGISIASTTQALYCEAVSGATNYRYEVRKQSDNSLLSVSTRGSSDNLFRLSWVSGVQLNTSYSIKVAAYVNGNWQEYGPSCIVTILPVTKLANTSCNVTIGSLSSALYAESLAGATNYRYEIRKQVDNSLIGVSVRGLSDTLFRLSWVSGVQVNTTYSIKVAAYINGMWTAYGTACTVTVPVSGMMQSEEDTAIENPLSMEDLVIETYPNPNDGNFTVSSSHEGTFRIINELGQLIQKVEITKENNYQTKVENLGQGVYFVTGMINNEVITKKVVVK